MNATISSIGIYLPETRIPNSYFETIVETSDQWIKERTGIENRFASAKDEYTTDLCVKAAQNLAKDYGKELKDVDFVIIATSTAEHIVPNIASQVQTRLGIEHAGCMDLSSACAGFVYGLIVAKGLVAAETHKKILVIGGDTLTKVTDYTDRNTCILFGDGAGAVLVEASEENNIFKGITDTDGSLGNELYLAYQPVPINGHPVTPNNKLIQNGRAVFKWAVSTLAQKTKELAEFNQLSLAEIDALVPHTANFRILDAVCRNLDFPISKCIENIKEYGNTSAASIPLAWHYGLTSGKIKPNDMLLLIGFGGGLTCAGICLKNNIDYQSHE